jgi:hypothetical protein
MAEMFTSNEQSNPPPPRAGAERHLTRRQLRFVRRLPSDHEFVGVLDRTPIVRQPDGRLSRVGVPADLEAGGPKAHESYLLVGV